MLFNVDTHLFIVLFFYCKNFITWNLPFNHFKCTVQWSSVHSHDCATVNFIHLQNFSSSWTETLYPLNSNSSFLPSLSPCESESHPVVSDSLQPHGYTVHGILQARMLEWVAVPFSRGSSQPRNRTEVSCIAGGFFSSWATGEVLVATIYFLTLWIWLFLVPHKAN